MGNARAVPSRIIIKGLQIFVGATFAVPIIEWAVIPIPRPLVGMYGLILLGYCVSVLIVLHIFDTQPAKNVGSVSRFGDSRLFRLFRWLYAIEMKDCGCLYVEDDTNGDYVKVDEISKIWLHTTEGAKIKYHAAERQRVRCENCGSHSSIIKRTGRTVEFWEDEYEAVPDEPREIVDEKIVS